jgi:hypothetical protein
VVVVAAVAEATVVVVEEDRILIIEDRWVKKGAAPLVLPQTWMTKMNIRRKLATQVRLALFLKLRRLAGLEGSGRG